MLGGTNNIASQITVEFLHASFCCAYGSLLQRSSKRPLHIERQPLSGVQYSLSQSIVIQIALSMLLAYTRKCYSTEHFYILHFMQATWRALVPIFFFILTAQLCCPKLCHYVECYTVNTGYSLLYSNPSLVIKFNPNYHFIQFVMFVCPLGHIIYQRSIPNTKEKTRFALNTCNIPHSCIKIKKSTMRQIFHHKNHGADSKKCISARYINRE